MSPILLAVHANLPSAQIIAKYHDFIEHVREATKSALLSNGQASIANSIVLLPIAANAISELNNILNRLIRIAYTTEAESNHLRQLPDTSANNDGTELYRQRAKDEAPAAPTERNGTLRNATSATSQATPHPHVSGTSLKHSSYSLLKQSDTRAQIRNQSAVVSTAKLAPTAFKLTPNMIADIFEDFFVSANDILD